MSAASGAEKTAAAAEKWDNATLLFYNDSHILVGLSIKKSKTRATQEGKGEFLGLKVPVPEVVLDKELEDPKIALCCKFVKYKNA